MNEMSEMKVKKPKKILYLPMVGSIFIFYSFMMITGCASHNSKFDCNARPGGRCAPMGEINNMVDQGLFDERSKDSGKNLGYLGTDQLAEPHESLKIPLGYSQHQNNHGLSPERKKERVQQIWIAPYEDIEGNYHEASYVYSVIKQSAWGNRIAREIEDD